MGDCEPIADVERWTNERLATIAGRESATAGARLADLEELLDCVVPALAVRGRAEGSVLFDQACRLVGAARARIDPLRDVVDLEAEL